MSATQQTTSELRLATWAQAAKRSALQDMLVLAARPGIVSFGLGLPNQELFPREQFAAVGAKVLTENPRTLQYGPSNASLKASIVELMKERGVECRPEQVFLTAGAQQGINLLARILLEPGGQVLMEEITYTGFQQVLEPMHPQILTVPSDPATGMDVDAVEELLKNGARPAFIYTVTDGHNPLGISLSPEKRQKLVALAREYGVPILEDDPYGFLAYEEVNTPPMRALDDEWVFYLGSFSKILAPGVRCGWAIVPEALTVQLSIIKEASDIDTTSWAQQSVAAFMAEGHLLPHIAKLRTEYGARRDTMLRALETHFPETASWHKPTNGMFIWVNAGEGIDVSDIYMEAVEQHNVAFFPGQVFAARADVNARSCMRLNFSNATHEQIETGIAALGSLLKK